MLGKRRFENPQNPPSSFNGLTMQTNENRKPAWFTLLRRSSMDQMVLTLDTDDFIPALAKTWRFNGSAQGDSGSDKTAIIF